MDRSGYTLIEFLAATLLASVVLGSAMLVLRTVARGAKEIAPTGKPSTGPAASIADFLESDLTKTVQIEITPGRMRLFRIQSDHLSAPSISPCDYRVVPTGGQFALVRHVHQWKSEVSDADTLLCARIQRMDLSFAEVQEWSSSKSIVPTSPDVSKGIYITANDRPIRLVLQIEGQTSEHFLFPRGLP